VIDTKAYRTVLFDLDGTLLDSNAAHAHAWCEALREYGVAVDLSRVRRLIGVGSDKLLPELAGLNNKSQKGMGISQRKKRIYASVLPTLKPTRGARALLEHLREEQIALVVASSADDEELTAARRQAGIEDLLPAATSRDQAAHSKPDADIVQAALASVGAAPSESVLIGDTPYDIESARKAGVKAIALRCGGYWSDAALAGAVAIYDDPQALLAEWSRQERDSNDAARAR
jgi:HAD superfamily hydrolase (TIGR01509 family)